VKDQAAPRIATNTLHHGVFASRIILPVEESPA
jgi:hypothetical protein